jgi:outer membrane lipoprotein SlyB
MAALIWRSFLNLGLILTTVGACGPSYSPDTYASNAVQQANKVEQGMVVGVRSVGVSAAGTVGTLTGAAAGGIAGSQAVAGPASAFTALGGSLVGGIAGSTVEHVTADTAAFEYIVRKVNGELVSVTQKDNVPLVLNQKVLVISGNQARVVPDYTLPPDITAAKSAGAPKSAEAEPHPDVIRPAEAMKPAEAVKPTEAVKPVEAVKPEAPPFEEARPVEASARPVL